jgi:tellurite resistance-related uncharacterized protein
MAEATRRANTLTTPGDGAGANPPKTSEGSSPYKTSPVFDEDTLPAGLRREHRTKTGVWGVIRVLDGRLRYRVLDPVCEVVLDPGRPGLILPDQPHLVEPLGPMQMQVEFYDHPPELPVSKAAQLNTSEA